MARSDMSNPYMENINLCLAWMHHECCGMHAISHSASVVMGWGWGSIPLVVVLWYLQNRGGHQNLHWNNLVQHVHYFLHMYALSLVFHCNCNDWTQWWNGACDSLENYYKWLLRWVSDPHINKVKFMTKYEILLLLSTVLLLWSIE
jgi:hypothetical protein